MYVQPTASMIIKPGHRLVDGGGLVRVPYNDHWTYPRSTLSELAQALSEVRGPGPGVRRACSRLIRLWAVGCGAGPKFQNPESNTLNPKLRDRNPNLQP